MADALSRQADHMPACMVNAISTCVADGEFSHNLVEAYLYNPFYYILKKVLNAYHSRHITRESYDTWWFVDNTQQ